MCIKLDEMGHYMDSTGPGRVRGRVFCEHGNEPSISLSDGEFLECRRSCYVTQSSVRYRY